MSKKIVGELNITINVDGPLASLQKVLRDAIAKLAFGLGGASSFRGKRLEMPGFPQIFMGKEVQVREVRKTFRPWLIGALLRDCIEGLDPVLLDVWQVTKILHLPTADQLAKLEDIDRFFKAKENFENRTLGQKLGNFRQESPKLIPSSWIRPLGQLVDLRNCLVHGGGVVRKRDLNAAKTLVVTWRVTELIVIHEDGSFTKVSRPMELKRSGHLALRERWKRRIFKLGQRIDISIQEFAEIAWSLYYFAVDLRSHWVELELKPRGLVALDLDLSRKLTVNLEGLISPPNPEQTTNTVSKQPTAEKESSNG